MSATDEPTSASAAGTTDGTATPLHLGLAEQGKLHAVAGEHDTALLYYRHAMRLAVESKEPEAFFRHYLECSIESLELAGSHDDVIDYCARVDAHYASIEPLDNAQAAFIARDLASAAQRRGLVLMKAGRSEESRNWLIEARGRAETAGLDLPLVTIVLHWLDHGLHIAPERILAEQRRLCYFAVTDDSVDGRRAVRLPPELLFQGGGA